jgi:hypothetical protein
MAALTARAIALLVLLLAPAPAAAQITLPPGFSSSVYVSGDGFGGGTAPGIPSMTTIGFDRAGALYLGRSGRRYGQGEGDDLTPIFRFPLGGARVTPDTERQFYHGPPLRNPQLATIRGSELFVTTFDRERRIGVLYRMVDGRAELFAGGTPAAGAPALLKQPEGAAVDSQGHIYVADREQGLVVRLDPTGRVLDPRHVSVTRPRLLAVDEQDRLWIGADAGAEAPWQPGPGEIWRVGADGVPSLVLRGPIPAAMAPVRGGHLLVADRQAARIWLVTAEGKSIQFAGFGEGAAPRSLTVAPVTPETRRAGIAGDLFVVTISRAAWQVNEVIRVSGPIDDLVSTLARKP